jgi:hypothetical protein
MPPMALLSCVLTRILTRPHPPDPLSFLTCGRDIPRTTSCAPTYQWKETQGANRSERIESLMNDELREMINAMDIELERAKHLTDLARLLHMASKDFFPHTLLLLDMIGEGVGRMETHMRDLTALLDSLQEEGNP